jgi:hypothetical protein
MLQFDNTQHFSMSRGDKYADAYREICRHQRRIIRDKFSQELIERPWVEAELALLEEEYDALDEKGARIVRSLTGDIEH